MCTKREVQKTFLFFLICYRFIKVVMHVFKIQKLQNIPSHPLHPLKVPCYQFLISPRYNYAFMSKYAYSPPHFFHKLQYSIHLALSTSCILSLISLRFFSITPKRVSSFFIPAQYFIVFIIMDTQVISNFWHKQYCNNYRHMYFTHSQVCLQKKILKVEVPG